MITSCLFPLTDMTGLQKPEIQIPLRDGGPNRSLVYRPESPAAPGPLLVISHSGGQCTCFTEVMRGNAVYLAKKHSATVVAAGYRLVAEWTFPKAPEDAWDVVKW
jgi:acetyl esterase/lipase